jgi:hypothetical protein
MNLYSGKTYIIYEIPMLVTLQQTWLHDHDELENGFTNFATRLAAYVAMAAIASNLPLCIFFSILINELASEFSPKYHLFLIFGAK